MSEERVSKPSRATLAAMDFENLMLDPKFKRFLFTVLDNAGMFSGNFHPDGRIHAAREGRRGLGLDILRTAERYVGPNALALIIEAEILALQETTNAPRSDYLEQRISELGGSDGLREPPGGKLAFLSYDDSDRTGDGAPDAGSGSRRG